MSPIPEEDDVDKNVIPITPYLMLPEAEFRKLTMAHIKHLHGKVNFLIKWYWVTMGGLAAAGYIVGQSGILERLAGGGK